MPQSMERSSLHVEGKDDLYSMVHLLIRHGVDYDAKPWPEEFPEFNPIGGVKKLLEGMELAVRLSSGRAIGFVLDADSPLLARWLVVRNHLHAVDVDAPEHPPAAGFLGQSATNNARVGVWLMPDNQEDGQLETFLQKLIEEDDPLIDHAKSATDTAKQCGAEFTDPDRVKAVTHCWLAWQEEPGRPYGTAICAKYFRHDAPVAESFVGWFKTLYGIA